MLERGNLIVSNPDSKPKEEEINKLLQEKLHFHLDENIEIILKIIQPSVDFHKRDFVIHGQKECKGACFYTEGLVNETNIQKILKSLVIFSPQMEKTLSGRHVAEKLKNKPNG